MPLGCSLPLTVRTFDDVTPFEGSLATTIGFIALWLTIVMYVLSASDTSSDEYGHVVYTVRCAF
jgi:hypothetical protein